MIDPMRGRWLRVLVLVGFLLAVTSVGFLLETPDWLAADNGPERKILEALSWIVTIVVPLTAFAGGIWRWVRRTKSTTGNESETQTPDNATDQLIMGRALHLIEGRLPRVTDVDMLTLGVKPALDTDSEVDLPPFVTRDLDSDLDSAIKKGGMILIHGPAASGKSRVAVEAIRRVCAESFLLVPASGTALHKLTEAQLPLHDTVIWLDDLENYLSPDGLDTAVLQQLCSSANSVVVVATMRDGLLARYDLASAADGQEETSIVTSGAELIEHIRGHQRFHIRRELSDIERAFASQRADPRILSALQAPEGFGEHLAAGPMMLARWSTGEGGLFQFGQAIISAAVDVRRAGYHQPIPGTKLYQLSKNYLAPGWKGRADLPTARESFRWAYKKVLGASSCLQQFSGDTYLAADYLLEHCQSKGSPLAGIPTPSHTWQLVLLLASPADSFTIGAAAIDALELRVAKDAFCQSAASGHSIGMHGLAVTLTMQGKYSEAEHWYRKAIELGNITSLSGLGDLLKDIGRNLEAEIIYRRGARMGDRASFRGLGDLLARKGLLDEAESAYRDAAAKGDELALKSLNNLLSPRGRFDELETLYRHAARTDRQGVILALGIFLQWRGKFDEAEAVYRRAANTNSYNSGEALNRLGNLLIQQDRLDEAEAVYRRAANTNSYNGREALNRLGNLLIQQDRLDEAEAVYRRAANTKTFLDDGSSIKRLCSLLIQQGRLDDAEALYRHTAATGNIAALSSLERLLGQRLQVEDVEDLYRQAAETTNPMTLTNLASFLARRGRLDEAEATYRKAAESNRTTDIEALGTFLEKQGQLNEAETIYRHAAETDNKDNGYILKRLAELLERQGRLDEAEATYRKAAESNRTIDVEALATFLEEQGRLDEAETIYRHAANTGDTMAQQRFGRFLEKHDRLGEAETIYRHAINSGSSLITFGLLGSSSSRLGQLLERQGRLDEAAATYRRAANTGDTAAQQQLKRLRDIHHGD